MAYGQGARGSYDAERIAEHATLSQQRAQDIMESIKNLHSAVQDLREYWTDPSAKIFYEAHEAWEQSIAPAQTKLEELAQKLHAASEQYVHLGQIGF